MTEQESYSLEDFKRVPKIDTHVHVITEEKTMILEARENNFKLLAMSLDVVPGYPPMAEQIRVNSKHHREDPDIFAYNTAFTLENWNDADWSEKVIIKIKKEFENGSQGIKIWKNIGMDEKDKNGKYITLEDPKFEPVFKFIKDQNKVLLSHAGEPKNCWLPLDKMTVNSDRDYFSKNPKFHMYKHPELPSYEGQMTSRDNMLKKNMGITFIGTHLATLEWSVERIAAFLDNFPNASVDLAERICHLQDQSQKNRAKVRDFIIKYQDRILYGTDFQQLEEITPDELKLYMNTVWMNDWKYFNTDEMMNVPQLNSEFQGLKLPKSVVDKIYHLNAERLFPKAWK